MTQNREDKALREFKNIMEDLLLLVVKSTASETGYMYWVNRSREQFVLETTHTIRSNVMFKDRIEFGNYYLDEFKDIKSPIKIKLDEGLPKERLTHYHNHVSANYITIIPFRNNNATVALTVLETEQDPEIDQIQKVISSYIDAHVNVLNTYLELTELYKDQKEWVRYDDLLDSITPKLDKVQIIDRALELMQKVLAGGGVMAILRGVDSWISVLKSEESPENPSLGLAVHQKSMVNEALDKGKPVFSIHFNQNPKRINAEELGTEGAAYAIPLLVSERRQAVILCYHSNPLAFKDSVKHQLHNIVRIAALSIHTHLPAKEVEKDVFTNKNGSFIRDVWELCLEKQLGRIEFSEKHTWFGFISIANLSEIRSRLRLEDLNRLQKVLVKALNPSRLGKKGFIGFNTDYVFTYMFFGSEKQSHKLWQKTILEECSEKIDIGNGILVELDLNFGSVYLESADQKSEDIISNAKNALETALKQADTKILNC